MSDLVGVVLGELLGNQFLFFIGQPGGLMHAIFEIGQYQQADDDGWNCLDDEHPLPARPAMKTCELIHDPT
ncbi:hypothetical protein D3C79_998200 [compost metagenome]